MTTPTEAALKAAGDFIYVEWDSGSPPEEPEEFDALNFYVGEMAVGFEDNDDAREMHGKLVSDLARRFDAYVAPLHALIAEQHQMVERKQDLLNRMEAALVAANETINNMGTSAAQLLSNLEEELCGFMELPPEAVVVYNETIGILEMMIKAALRDQPDQQKTGE